MDAWFSELFDEYFGDEITLSEFWREFLPAVCDLEEQWIYSVKLHLFEYSAGHWSQGDLKERIREIVVTEGKYEGTGSRPC